MMACASSPSGVSANSGLRWVCMARSQLGVETPGIEHAHRIEGLFQSLVDAHQHIAHRHEYAAGFVGATDERRMSARERRSGAHLPGSGGGAPPALGTVPPDEL